MKRLAKRSPRRRLPRASFRLELEFLEQRWYPGDLLTPVAWTAQGSSLFSLLGNRAQARSLAGSVLLREVSGLPRAPRDADANPATLPVGDPSRLAVLAEARDNADSRAANTLRPTATRQPRAPTGSCRRPGPRPPTPLAIP